MPNALEEAVLDVDRKKMHCRMRVVQYLKEVRSMLIKKRICLVHVAQ